MNTMKRISVLLRPGILISPGEFAKCAYSWRRGVAGVAKEEKRLPGKVITELLTSFGFSGENIEEMSERYPGLGGLPAATLSSSLSGWAECQFGEERLVRLLVAHPGLTAVSGESVREAFLGLRRKFTAGYVYRLLSSSPDVVVQNRKTLEEKLDYLLEGVRVPKAEVVNSGALSHDLSRLRERVEFLTRAGVFRNHRSAAPPPPGAPTNPRLDLVVNTTDEYFATQVARLTLFEYEVFQELYSESETRNTGSDSE